MALNTLKWTEDALLKKRKEKEQSTRDITGSERTDFYITRSDSERVLENDQLTLSTCSCSSPNHSWSGGAGHILYIYGFGFLITR